MKISKLIRRLGISRMVIIGVALIPTILGAMVPAFAQVSTPWQQLERHDAVKVRLLLPGKTDSTQNVVHGLLQVRLAPPWKTYWRTPGEGGVPPEFAWQESSHNVSAIDWQFPVPERFSVQGIETVGYQGNVSIPWRIRVADWQQQVQLKGNLTLASCTNICVISDYPLTLNFAPSELKADMDAMFLLEQAQSRVPHANHPLVDITSISWSSEQQTLEVSVKNQQTWQHPRIFVDSLQSGFSDLAIEQLSQRVEGDTLTARFVISHWLEAPDLAGATMQVTLADDRLQAELSAKVSQVTADMFNGEPRSDLSSLGIILAFALLGGLILNIMPCVLPVLGLKLKTIVVASAQRNTIRKNFVAAALGIVFSFVLLAVMVMVLKATGHAIGWGIQFQNPYFVGFMALVTAIFAISVSGLWHIRLPSRWQQWLATRGDNSAPGHFVQGMFATLLATPCTAPFLGTAVAFALAASNGTLLLVFMAIGVGMALPWLLVALWPQLSNKLPKPGAWLAWVNRVFALLLMLTSLWLVSILVSQISPDAPIASGADTEQTQWQPLNGQAIEKALADNKVVFIDVTADWCVTCQANKYNVLMQQPVAGALQQEHVVSMRGDWTRANQRITDFLQANGRFGVPFNQVFGPGAPEGIILPVILTDQAVLDALQQAAKRSSSKGSHEES